jgi:DNA uptake protein ComE-like DNA-binding protein
MVALITGMQVLIYFSKDFFPGPDTAYDPILLEEMNAQLDSMLLEQRVQRDGPRRFNPNYITDFKGYVLGMSPDEIDRLLAFREKGLFVSSADDFQRVTGVSDSLLEVISPRFRFPSFEKKRAPAKKTLEKKDLNSASIEDFREVPGVGEVLSKRIVAYRDLLGGYAFEDQLFEVYNLPVETARRLLERFEIKERPVIKKLNINTASFRQILALPYVDYDLTRRIVQFRKQEKVITDLTDLKKIDSFPLDHFDRIAVYLLAE